MSVRTRFSPPDIVQPMAWRILCVAGARPNFMKVAPLLRAFAADARFDAKLVHTGQHYDEKLSKVFFEELGMPRPDLELAVGSGTHAVQTAEIMKRFESVLEAQQPEAVLVVGDVNSTAACAITTAKFLRKEPFMTRTGSRRRPLLIHVEAGLRSGDRDMPEEINRILTDSISDLLFVSERSGMENLEREGLSGEHTQLVGNVMIDSLLAARDRARESKVLVDLQLQPTTYAVVTLHRPSNVDDPSALRDVLTSIEDASTNLRLVFPVHPRSRARMTAAGIALDPARWTLVEPLGYLDFVRLLADARCVFTDSGGIQEETTVLGVPCITLRPNTERPITVDEGTNQLVGMDRDALAAAFRSIDAVRRAATVPALWDGQSAQRIVEAVGRLIP